MSPDQTPCEGKFTILGLQNKCLLCGGPLKIHLPQFNGNPERVIKTPMIPEDEYMALGSNLLADGITRVLVPPTATDEEIAFIQEELRESDATLASIAKVTEFFEGSESPAEALAGAETEDPGGLEELVSEPWDPTTPEIQEKLESREFSDGEKELFRAAFMNKLSADIAVKETSVEVETNVESTEDQSE